ncbi:DUF4011 domain-containing protein [Sinomonas sp. G460-2]|uniref:DUF4011 domain-containing protein n=1 Tax=Sinomonas sp. G460-2 TaxID=3393464 RepID=UPI0039F0FA70
MPIRSTGKRRSAPDGAEESTDVPQQPTTHEDGARLEAWLSSLPPVMGPDTMLSFLTKPEGVIDLTGAHASGLAQLLAGRRTRLSTLIRERQDYTTGARAARNLRAKIYELANDRGIDAGYLAAGVASWTSAVGGKPRRVSAPVLLAGVALTVRSEQDDFEIKLNEQAHLNPALVRHLQTVHRIDIDTGAIERLAYSTARLDPHPVLERVRSLLSPIPGATVDSRLLVSTFADLENSLDDPAITPDVPVIAALAAASKGAVHVAPEPLDASRFAPIDDRAPADELLVLDADRDQQLAVDSARAGDSFVVETPPGTGQTQTAVNVIANLVDAGRTVLVVAERRASLVELTRTCDQLGLGSMLLQLGSGLSAGQLKQQLVRAIVRNEKAEQPRLDGVHRVLSQRRHQLIEHVESLHNVRERWGCSPYEAMQSLARLTSIQPSPATTVRLKRSVLDSIRERRELAERLQRAAELGSFSREATKSPWYGARMLTRRETEDAQELVHELVSDLPALRERMAAVASYSEIRLGASVEEWGQQIELLVAVRESLDKFTPDIFDRPVNDLIAATASSAWRRERGIEIPAMQRSRLRRVAKEYVRPGVHLADLHNSLILVQEQRALWADYAVSQRHPAVPSGLADLAEDYRVVHKGLGRLGTILARTRAGGSLVDEAVVAVQGRLQDLAESADALRSLPERTLLEDELRERGLGELLSDLAEREAVPEVVASELELAWWQSVLEAMISGDDYLAMSDGGQLRQAEVEFRRADRAHIQAGPARVRWKLSRAWERAIHERPREAESLRNLLRDGRISLANLESHAGGLVRPLAPVWTASPYTLASAAPARRRFDAVVILDAETLPVRAALPAIARARQVVAFGDAHVGNPKSFTVGVGTGQPSLDDSAESALTALSKVLPTMHLSTVYRGVDEDLGLQLSQRFYHGALNRLPDGQSVTGLDRALVVEYLPDGTGLPAGQDGNVESTAAEVNRVVDLVFEHAAQRPSSSLAVVTASAQHAARVGEAIRLQMANHTETKDFFGGVEEPFRVVPVDRAGGLVRDHIIFSLGFGRTPHGRAMHHFGPLSEQGGRRRFALAMSRARYSMHVLSCFQPGELDLTRLGEGASDFYELLERELAGRTGLGTRATRAAASTEALGADPLVTDLGDRLASRGARVWHHYDGAIDMAAAVDPLLTMSRDEPELSIPVAVESDGTKRYRELSVRERTRQRPELLERMGWRYVTLWTIEVFTDPGTSADMIADVLGLDGQGEDGAGAGFLNGAREGLEPAATAPRNSRGASPRTSAQERPNRATAPRGGDPLGGGAREPEPTRRPEDQRAAPEQYQEASPVAARDHLSSHRRVTSPATGVDPEEAPEPVAPIRPAPEGGRGVGTRATASNGEAPDRGRRALRSADSPDGSDVAPLIPRRAAEDDPRSWGDADSDGGHDDWLREQRPPHWG